VAAVLSKMDDQAICSGQFNQYGSGQRVRLFPSPGLPERSHMVNIDSQSSHMSSRGPMAAGDPWLWGFCFGLQKVSALLQKKRRLASGMGLPSTEQTTP